MAKHYGLDLGTTYTRLFEQERGIVLREPSAVAVKKQTGEVFAVGAEARKMLGKTPADIAAFAPVHNSVMTDFEIGVAMLGCFFHQIGAVSFWHRPSVAVCVPHGATEVERRAVEDAVFDAGARYVAVLDQSIAAAIGSGLRISDAHGSMIVDIGSGTAEMAVISLGGVVSSSAVKNAGREFDLAVMRYLKQEKNLQIGEMTAEYLKRKIGSAHPSIDVGSETVTGRDVRDGRAKTVTVTSGDIREALQGPIEKLCAAVRATLEETPPELTTDIYDLGMMLTGGSAKLPGVDRALSERLGIRVTLSKHPSDAVCLGIGRFIENNGSYRNLKLHYKSR